MGKTTRFHYFSYLSIGLLLFFIVLGFLSNIAQEYFGQFSMYTRPLYWLIGFLRTVSMLGFITIILYFVYTGYRYLTSSFHRKYQIPVHEAFFHGYFDLAYVYDRLLPYGTEVTADTKMRTIIVKYETVTYYVIVRDIFGRLQGEAKDDTWYIVSKKRKQYGNVRYLKRKPVRNPIYENRDYLNKLPKQDTTEIKNYVCLTGLRRNTFNHDQINTVYELEALLQHQKK